MNERVSEREVWEEGGRERERGGGGERERGEGERERERMCGHKTRKCTHKHVSAVSCIAGSV